MALDSATGVASVAEAALATVLSECAAYQSFLGAVNSTAALARTFFGALDLPAGDEHDDIENLANVPYGLITTLSTRTVHVANGSGLQTTNSGELRLELVTFDDPDITPQENYRRHMNLWGALPSQIFSQIDPGHVLSITAIDTSNERELPPDGEATGLGNQDDEDDPYAARWHRTLTVSWSSGAP